MNEKGELNRETKFGVMSALAAGILSAIIIFGFVEFFAWPFIPAVMIAVFLGARSAFKRRMQRREALTRKKIIQMAFEVGTWTHFYTFALYLPLHYFFIDFELPSLELIGGYFLYTLILSLVSLLMFVWIAVPMYIGVGFLMKSTEKELFGEVKTNNETLLDDGLLSSE